MRARAAVLEIGHRACALTVYERRGGTVRRVGRRRQVDLYLAKRRPRAARPGESVDRLMGVARGLVSQARTQRAGRLLAVARASLGGARWMPQLSKRLRRELSLELDALDAAREARYSFLAALHKDGSEDGVVLDLDQDGLRLARFRGRVLASTLQPRFDRLSRRIQREGGTAARRWLAARVRRSIAGGGRRKTSGAQTLLVTTDAVADGIGIAALAAPVPPPAAEHRRPGAGLSRSGRAASAKRAGSGRRRGSRSRSGASPSG